MPRKTQKAGGYTFNFDFINGIPILGRTCAPDIKSCAYELPKLSGGAKKRKSKKKSVKKSKKNNVAKK
jgi:hypothetical protein